MSAQQLVEKTSVTMRKIPGGLWEYRDLEYHQGYLASSFCIEMCSHAVLRPDLEETIGDETFPVYEWPNVLIGFNEGHHNSVGICLDCIQAALNR